jgi:primosomal protein N' (replication factor Y)
MEKYHELAAASAFVEVLLPLAIPKHYTYQVPEELTGKVAFGLRVEVQFGDNKLYSGIILEVHSSKPVHRVKSILSVIDEIPVIGQDTLRFWKWLSEYYACTLGEVMEAAMPANLKLSSERRIVLNPYYDGNFEGLSGKEFLIAEALSHQSYMTIDDVRRILNQKTVLNTVKSLMSKHVIQIYEELKEKFIPKRVEYVRLSEPYRTNEDLLHEAFELVSRSQKQTDALLAYIQLSQQLGDKSGRTTKGVLRQEIYKVSQANASVLSAMAKKGIFELFDREVSRIEGFDQETSNLEALSEEQKRALEETKEIFKKKSTVLLFGVTGSGKTRIYVELINETLLAGKQVLYLLPEVALTTQIITRLQKNLGDAIKVYHHRITNNERVELWQAVMHNSGQPEAGTGPIANCVVGARSALLLPFTNLGLIIVDEEHDSSYKQKDPAPRYSGRDAAVFLAHLHGAKVVLGTATPSLESYYNAKTGKYGLVCLKERYGGLQLPEVVVIDAKEETKKGRMQSHFSGTLIEDLQTAISNKEQAILFQNRRGYAPTMRCNTCGWHSECLHCDVSLTYHKFKNNLQCHYCGFQMTIPQSCPACGGAELKLQGFGTEKIEDEIKIFLPEAAVSRLDYDSARTKDAYAKILNDFEERRTDILVGTQMVTKGLDFENVGIVGVLSSDQLLQFPDFRSGERGFQMMVQVAGRAGRKNKRGKVLIQAVNTTHPVLKEVIDSDYEAFFNREILERKSFAYPPFSRLIQITLKHKKPDVLNKGTKIFATHLKSKLGNRMLGPSIPQIGRVRGHYLLDILLKLEMNPTMWKSAKEEILTATQIMQSEKGLSAIRVNVDVDPI